MNLIRHKREPDFSSPDEPNNECNALNLPREIRRPFHRGEFNDPNDSNEPSDINGPNNLRSPAMILRRCVHCEFHEIRDAESGQMSHCKKENCWSRYSKCVAYGAIERFLDQERVDTKRRFSALEHVYKERG